MASTFTMAVVATHTHFGEDAREVNLAAAREYALRAADQGAKLVCFPESFPGAWRRPVTWTPVAQLGDIAREAGVYLVGGFTEPIDDAGDRCFNSLVLMGPDGTEVGRYRRTTPAHAPWVYAGGQYWDFDWVNDVKLPVFDTDLGRIGMIMCSEVYVPELARALAVKGAEIILMPAGLTGPGPLYDTWRTLAFARAIENLAYTALSSNLVRPDRGGLAMICSPEQILVESTDEGIHLAEVNLDRVRWLRAQQDGRILDAAANGSSGAPAGDTANPATARPWRTKPGTLRDWRRQAVFDANPELWRGGAG